MRTSTEAAAMPSPTASKYYRNAHTQKHTRTHTQHLDH